MNWPSAALSLVLVSPLPRDSEVATVLPRSPARIHQVKQLYVHNLLDYYFASGRAYVLLISHTSQSTQVPLRIIAGSLTILS
jgi:hypothetical protein